MKKSKILQLTLLFLTVFAFSSCEDLESLNLDVKGNVDSTLPIIGLEGATSFSKQGETNFALLLQGTKSSFVKANIQSVTITLEDYAGSAIDVTLKVLAGEKILFDKEVSLSKNPTFVGIPDNAQNVLALIESGSLPITVSGVSAKPIDDNDFKMKLSFNVAATIK